MVLPEGMRIFSVREIAPAGLLLQLFNAGAIHVCSQFKCASVRHSAFFRLE